MVLKGLVHKVFGPPPGAMPRQEQTIKPEPPPEETAPVMAAPSSAPPEPAAAPVIDTGQANEDLGPLERMSPAVDIDTEELEKIGEKVKNEVETISDIPPTSVADAPEAATETAEPPVDETAIAAEEAATETAEPPVDEIAIAAEEAADTPATGEIPAAAEETAEPPADEAAAANETGTDEENEGGEGEGEGEGAEGGSMFDSLFSGMNEIDEDDYLSRLITSIPDITAQDLLDQAEELKALMQDLS